MSSKREAVCCWLDKHPRINHSCGNDYFHNGGRQTLINDTLVPGSSDAAEIQG